MADDLVELIKIGPFGGVDLTSDPLQMSPYLSPNAVNVVPYRRYGAMAMTKARTASVFFSGNSNALANLLLFISQFGLLGLAGSSTGQIIAQTLGSSSYTLSLPSGGSYTAGNKIRAASYSNLCFLSDGVDRPLKVQPTSATAATTTFWQINPPTSAPTLSAGAAGNLNGSYYYTYTYSNSSTGQESSHSPISSQLSVGNLQIAVGYATSADPQVDKINIYRLGGTFGTWQLVATIANSGSSYTDNTADSSLTGQTLILHRDPPANFVAVCLHKDRLWGLGYNQSYAWTFSPSNSYVTTAAQPSDLWFTRYAEPWSFDAVNNVLPVGRESYGDVGVGLASVGDILAVHKSLSTWFVRGDSEQDFRIAPAFPIGAISQDLICTAFGLDFWLSPSGHLWMWDGQSAPTNISEGDEKAGGIQGALDAANGNFTNWSMFAYGRCIYLVSPNGVTYGFYPRTKSWFTLGFGSKSVVSIQEYPYAAGLNSGATAADQWFSTDGTDSSGSKLTASWQSGVFDCGVPNGRKLFRFLWIVIPPSDPANSITVTLYVDGAQVYQTTLNPRASGTPSQMSQGGSSYRLPLPTTAQGYNAVVSVSMTTANSTPPVVSKLSIFGSMKDINGPTNQLGGGGQ